jgi:hypothetical protein
MTSSFFRPSRHLALLTFLAAFWGCFLGVRSAEARINGVASTLFLSRNPASCNACHSGGTAPTNMVNLSASSMMLTPGQQITLTLTVATINGSPGAAGFNLRSSQQGTFAVGGPSSTMTQIVTGTNSWTEATHTEPKQGEPAAFTVLWTPNAAATGTVTFTAWGNAVNQSGTPAGDQAASTTLNVTVCNDTFYLDADADGFGDPAHSVKACSAPGGYVANNTDCNDGSGNVHPGATEVCNGVDDNCAGGVDEGVTSMFYRDMDADGFGNPSISVAACSAPSGYVANNTDCDDSKMAVHPGATEVCNGIDDNCTGGIDEGVTGTFYRDVDADGYGNPSVSVAGCSPPAGYVTNNSDCNDENGAIKPGASEVCNGIDDNCGGGIDEGLATSTFYFDSDGDTFGNPGNSKVACSAAQAGAKYVANNTDCDDTNANISPAAPEVCANQKDDNCNGVVDTDAPANSTFYKDNDGDGFGSAASGTTTACAPPAGYVSSNTDCNDGVAAIHPGAPEVCNGMDDNCSGSADEDLGSLSCGDGPCRTTVAACVGGATQVCAVVCTDAGADAAKEAESTFRDAGVDSTKDGATTSDVVIAADTGQGGSNDAISQVPPDAAIDGSAPPVSQDGSVGSDAIATSRDAKGDGRAVDGAPPPPGANEDNGAPTDSGCSCHLAAPSGHRDAAIFGVMMLSLLVSCRRTRRRDREGPQGRS